MPKVTYIEFNGQEHTVEVEKGLSIMEGAVQNNVPGIDADCGGSCACATCHVYVDEDWKDKLPDQSDAETAQTTCGSLRERPSHGGLAGS